MKNVSELNFDELTLDQKLTILNSNKYQKSADFHQRIFCCFKNHKRHLINS